MLRFYLIGLVWLGAVFRSRAVPETLPITKCAAVVHFFFLANLRSRINYPSVSVDFALVAALCLCEEAPIIRSTVIVL